MLSKAPPGKGPSVLWEPERVLGPVSLQSPWPSLVWEPQVPFGTRGSPASSALSFACRSGSQGTFSVPGAFVLPVALCLHLKQVPSQWNSGSDPVSLDPVPAMGFHKVGNPDMVQEARAATNKLCLSLFLNPFCSINLPLLLNTPKAKPMSQFMEVRGPIAAGCNFLLMSEAWLVFMGWLISHVHGWEE